MTAVRFADRRDAGRALAPLLRRFRDRDPVVLGLPRGGVPVADEVAMALDAPLDVIVVRKLGVPSSPELAMGAIAEGRVRALERGVLAQMPITDADFDEVEARERAALDARVARLRRTGLSLDLTGRTALIIDDGIATGSTARAASMAARHAGAAYVVVAAPVAPVGAADSLTDADEVVCVAYPRDFWAVGAYYRDFSATSDEEVATILESAARRTASS